MTSVPASLNIGNTQFWANARLTKMLTSNRPWSVHQLSVYLVGEKQVEHKGNKRSKIYITLWVDFTGKLQAVRICEIDVSCRDCQNHSVGAGDIFHQHVTDLPFDITRLISDRYLQQNMV